MVIPSTTNYIIRHWQLGEYQSVTENFAAKYTDMVDSLLRVY